MKVDSRVYYTDNKDSEDLGTVLEVTEARALVRWDKNNPDSCECEDHHPGNNPKDCLGEWFYKSDLTVAEQ